MKRLQVIILLLLFAGCGDKAALLKAVAVDDIDDMHSMIENGDYINEKNEKGETALMLLAYKGKTAMVEAILDKGALVDAKDNLGKTALMLAAKKGHTDIVKALLDKNANPNIKDIVGWTAMKWAEKKDHTQIIKMLKAARAVESQEF